MEASIGIFVGPACGGNREVTDGKRKEPGMNPRRKSQRWHDLDQANIPLGKLIRLYETFNRTEGKSPKTISW